MKVAHLVLSLAPGGLERLVCRIVQSRVMDAVQFVVFCLDEPGALAGEVLAVGGKVELVRRKGGLDLGLVPRLAERFREEKIDVVHSHSLDTMFYGALAARWAGVPLVFHTQHNTLLEQYTGSEKLKFRLAVRMIDKIIAVSAETDRTLAVAGVAPARRTVILNGVDVERYQQREDSRDACLAARPLVLGTVSRLAAEKGIDRLLRALARLDGSKREPRLRVVGEGPERVALEALAHELGLDDRVEFLGFRDDVIELLSQLDLFLLPSLTEGIPLALLEAMASGLPVVATKVGGVPEVIEAGLSGVLVPADDVEALAGAISELLEQAERRKALGRAAARRIEAHFSLAAMCTSYRRLYESSSEPVSAKTVIKNQCLKRMPAELLAWRGRANGGQVALTFDDGPEPRYTPRLLEILNEYGAVGTFFLVGEKVQREPEITRRIVEQGHELGNHSYTHPRFEELSWRDALDEIARTQLALHRAGRYWPRLWRPPRGKLNSLTLMGAWKHGLTVVMWSLDLKDFAADRAEEIEQRLALNDISAGEIVLYHGNSEAALDALPALLERVRRSGLECVTVTRLLGAA
ncbi:MAG: GT4 family glycosyltransferase PelF [Acidobacteriota bacterium]|nr:MAG: GT4 family glycosyltransferase PelF [Acidobacteriota bacterium]